MLKKLCVRNFVLIDELEINFSDGLTIITGETGAGKSILLGALNLILGQRADHQSLLTAASKCVVEAVFDIKNYGLESFFEANDLDYEKETTVRREITPEGKSRAFINDTPVTLTVLKSLTSALVDIHSQHETLLINQSGFQLKIVDAFAGNAKLLQQYTAQYKEYRSVKEDLTEALEKEQQVKSESDYLNFQLNELTEASLNEGEQEKLEEEQERLTHAEEIAGQINHLIQLLAEGEDNLISGLSTGKQLLHSLTRFGSPYKELEERIAQLYLEIKDIAGELNSAASNTQADPRRLEQLQERLAVIYRMQQKHRVDSVNALIALMENLQQKLEGIHSLEEQISSLQKEELLLETSLRKLSGELAEKRREAAPKIEKEILRLLSELAMPHARLKVSFITAEENEFYPDGKDKVNFLFAANKGSEYREIQKSASGGELSRIMLCIKALQAGVSQMPTLIFDEIDTGISGETAAKTGAILKSMSAHHQLLSITHLPQIAARGNAHIFVFKETGKSHTRTRLRQLTEEERVREVARLLSGEQLTPAALDNARDLLATT
jgi:DNA repair protein RecN (Recombination protein N)